jgi:thioredoxin reductase
VVATGFMKPYIPPIPGGEMADVYTDVSVDPAEFTNKRVLIVGKGNSAFETADNLTETAQIIHIASPNSVKFAWRTHFVGHLRAVNNNMVDTYQLKSQNAILDCNIDRIQRRPDGKYVVSVTYKFAHGEQEDLVYDRVILCTGFRFDSDIFDAGCKPELAINDRFPKQTSAWESVNVPHLYFAGTLTQQRDFKKTTSGFIHGFRYNVRALHRIFERRYHGCHWPCTTIPRTPEGFSKALFRRINTSSGLWQQFGFFGDLIVPGDNGHASYYEEVPTDFIRDGQFGNLPDYYVLTLEYGDHSNRDLIQPKADYRPHKNDVAHADQSPGLHPIIRRYRGQKLVAEHHVIEHLYAEWYEGVHTEPLGRFLDEQLEETAGALA